MKKLLVCLLVFAVLWGVGHILAPTGTWRYRLTVEVETPEGIKTGSAVREVKVVHGIPLTPESRPSTRVKGEAVMVDLGERGKVFALLDHAFEIVHRSFPLPGSGVGGIGTTPEAIRYYASLKSGVAEVATEWRPRMVTFADMQDPTSVQLVYQTDWCEERNEKGGISRYGCVKADNFAAIFGGGVRLKHVTIEMTEDEVTTGVDKFLPSYTNQTEYMKWFKTKQYGDPLQININAFK